MTADDRDREIESLLWDCVTEPDDDNAYRGEQTAGISKMAELIADQQDTIARLQQRTKELEDALLYVSNTLAMKGLISDGEAGVARRMYSEARVLRQPTT